SGHFWRKWEKCKMRRHLYFTENKRLASSWLVKFLGVNRRNVKFSVTSVSAGGSSLQFDAPFPADYEQLLDQAKDATQTALDDRIQLMEWSFLEEVGKM
nr:protein low PSII accumulation 3, chloroplastic [Tanacetum cinerariifolium]